MLEGLVASAVVLFFIFDPFASLPIFISLTKDQDQAQMIKSANRAIIVAALLFIIFALVGEDILDLFGISISSFRVAGGLVLMMMAIEVIFGIEISKHKNEDVAWVVIATPILTGPGVIATAILLVDQYDVVTVLLAGGFALFITWLALHNSVYIVKKLGRNTIEIFSRIIGLIIAALAVEYILSGTIDYIEQNLPDLIMGLLS
jgi:multiple antibiotic resistance protein